MKYLADRIAGALVIVAIKDALASNEISREKRRQFRDMLMILEDDEDEGMLADVIRDVRKKKVLYLSTMPRQV